MKQQPHKHQKQDAIEVHTHESAVIGSGVFSFEASHQQLVEPLKYHLKNMAAWVDREGGIIGHLKVYLNRTGTGALLSITDFDEEVSVKQNNRETAELSLAVIVYNIEPERLKTKLADLVGEIRDFVDRIQSGNQK